VTGSYDGVTAVVVAGLGRDEERAVRAALDARVRLIALVASHTRSAILLDAMDLAADERARIRPHAGIDIGARTPKEIALSVLAEIVREMRTAGLSAPAAVKKPAAASHAEAAAFAKAEPEFVAGPALPVGPATFTPSPVPEAPAATAIDPICGMTVVIGPDTHHAVVDGEDFWFCCPGCKKKYTRDRA
jgi:xanthine dehydrogenase accessory factor